MLITKYVKVKWNSKIVRHYKELGYEYTKIGDEFEAKVSDLTKGSNIEIMVKCDYCGKEYLIKYCRYYNSHTHHNKNGIFDETVKDACNNVECYEQKAKEEIFKKFGVHNVREIEWINEKIRKTNLEKYGCENPFGNKKVQEKIRQFFRNNYGVDFYCQTDEQKEKSKKTQLEKYGVENYAAWLSTQRPKEKSPIWKGGYEKHGKKTATIEYRHWRKAVFDRDLYTCQCCGSRGNTYLQAHHIKNWRDNEDCRFDVDNGITLCQKCHMSFHSKYGKRFNTEEQLKEFIEDYKKNNKIDKKIC